MANIVTARPTTRVHKHLEHSPIYKAELTLGGLPNPGVPAAFDAPPLQVDRCKGGEIYVSPNILEEEYIGAQTERKGGIIKAGIENLEFDVRSYHFIRYAIRDMDSPWGYYDQLYPLTMQGGTYSALATEVECARIWGAKFDTLELSQEFSDEGAPLTATATLMALGGAPANSGALVPVAAIDTSSCVQYKKKMSYHCGGGGNSANLIVITTPTGADPYRLRSWKLTVRNNLHYVNYGDLAPASGRIAWAREAVELREGEEEVEFECEAEIPFLWTVGGDTDPEVLTYDLFPANGFTPGTVGATILYSDNSITGQAPEDKYLRFLLSNLVITDVEFRYTYSATDLNTEPVHIYTFRAKKDNRKAASVAIYNTAA